MYRETKGMQHRLSCWCGTKGQRRVCGEKAAPHRDTCPRWIVDLHASPQNREQLQTFKDTKALTIQERISKSDYIKMWNF